MRLLWLCFFLFSSQCLAAVGDMPKEQQLAINYMQTLTSYDFNQLSKYYDRETVFVDKTANKKYTGEKQIINFLRRAHQGVVEYRFNLEHMFNSGSLVVLMGSYYLKGPGDQFGKPGKIIEIAVPGVTSLKLDTDKGRIKEHADLIDYQTMTDQLAVQ